jgi:hypothetical protein
MDPLLIIIILIIAYILYTHVNKAERFTDEYLYNQYHFGDAPNSLLQYQQARASVKEAENISAGLQYGY